jgi:predicted nuclease of predicted toxin-antitoxin system
MGVPRRSVEGLAALGWDVSHVAALGTPRATDESILALAKRETRTIVTFDSDFAKLLATTRAKEPSVIHLRIQRLTHPRAAAMIREVVAAIEKDLEAGCIATVTDGVSASAGCHSADSFGIAAGISGCRSLGSPDY